MILADDLIEASSSVGATCRDGGGRWLDVKIERFIILLVLSREFSGMIHWLAINFVIPATPIAIHSLRLAPVSHDESLGFTLSSTDSRDNIISKSIGGVS